MIINNKLSALFLLYVSMGAASAQVNPKEKLGAAITAIERNYVDPVNDEKLTDAAIAGMLTQLDPHSKYYSRLEMEAHREMMSGSFAGIGIQYMMQNDSACVTQVFDAGPAEAQGLLVGDRIIDIDGKQVISKNFGNAEIMKMIRGERNTTIKLHIYRPSAHAFFDFVIIRGTITDSPIRSAYMLSDKIGYINLGIFGQTTRPEMDKALAALKAKGMKSLILDLQGNGGGYVQAALGMADEFLKRDALVYYTVGNDKGKDYYYSAGTGGFTEEKLIVLIDQYTASASEILTGALQDWDRAVIVGRRSFGKGLMQKPVTLLDGSVLELTGARYYTPSGRSLQKPYANYDAEIKNRFANGELTDETKIKHSDSLKYQTQVYKKTVFGGGGIIPDKFVAVDTLVYNSLLKEIAATGLVNKAAFKYVDENRLGLEQLYPLFEQYVSKYQPSAELINGVVQEAEKLGIARLNQLHGSVLAQVRLELKAQIASQLFKGNIYYTKIVNTQNQNILKAIELLNNPAAFNSCIQGHSVRTSK